MRLNHIYPNLEKALGPRLGHLSKQQVERQWKGAVLCLLVDQYLFLIKRSLHTPSHKGQVAFVGGKREANEDPQDCALREFEEETGLARKTVSLHGFSEPVYAGHETLLIPVVGEYQLGLGQFTQDLKNNQEWNLGLFLDYQMIKEEKHWAYAWRQTDQTEGAILFCPLEKKNVPHQWPSSSQALPLLLWGATARIVWNLTRTRQD